MKAEEAAWWDDWNVKYRAGGFDEQSAAAKTGWLALREIRSLGLPNPIVLEVGCGTGWLGRRLEGHAEYVGLDLSPAAVEAARKLSPNHRFVAADFLDWVNPDEAFDVIVMIDTIAYFRDQNAALARAKDLLKAGGYLVVTTVNPFVFSRMSWIGAPGKGQVRNWLTRGALHGLLQRNGFTLLKSHTVFPAGDRGILRLINSRKLNRAVSRLVRESWLTRAKEALQLGQYRIVVARGGARQGGKDS